MKKRICWTYFGVRKDIPWCQRMLESWRKVLQKKISKKPLKFLMKQIKKTTKRNSRPRSELNGHILVVGDLDRAGEELYPTKNQQKPTIAAATHPKQIFRPQNSQKSDLNGQKHINTP